jgi:hypothetical protein
MPKPKKLQKSQFLAKKLKIVVSWWLNTCALRAIMADAASMALSRRKVLVCSSDTH